MDYLDMQRINEMISNGIVTPLETEYEIEDLMKIINTFDTNVDFYEGLKKDRVSRIQSEIDKINRKKDFLKQVIQATLDKFNKKSLSFPGVGKIVSKDIKGKWIINDEGTLLQILKGELPQSDYDNIVSQKTVVDKKEVDKILDGWEKINKTYSCFSKEDSKKSVTIKFDKESNIESMEIPDDEDILANKEKPLETESVVSSENKPMYDTLETEF